MDIVVRLRQGIDPLDMVETEQAMDSGADTIEFLRTEITRLGESLDKCHAKLMGTINAPVHGPELERSLAAGGRYRAPECGGFQGSED